MTILFLPHVLFATDLEVGPGKKYAQIEEALAAAKPGDVILVYPLPNEQPYTKVHLAVYQPRLTIKAVVRQGQYIRLDGMGFDYSGQGRIPRAIVQFNKGADECLFEGFELTGAHNNSHNGAGVRINQANRITIRGCSIHANDMGIMSNGDGTPQTANDQLIENSRIFSNGDKSDPGYNHNLYMGGMSVTIRGCEISSSLTGHNIKSRAHRTVVAGCYIHDSANRELDLVDDKAYTGLPGSDAVLAGNIIVKSTSCPGNRNVIHFGKDGGGDHDGTLYLIHNTVITTFISPVIQLSAPKAKARVYNNIIWDDASGRNGMVFFAAGKETVIGQVIAGARNWLSSGFQNPAFARLPLPQTVFGTPRATLPFVDSAKGKYALIINDPTLVDNGSVLPSDIKQVIEGKILVYRPPLSTEIRPDDGKPDIGAYEFVR